ncbi:calcium-binding protein [Propionivibrio sp.]|uniref:calcium-binding protein n=1 Tax=Propionivibrio sp. TaxID=2212460 RepID=UPI003BF1CF24
MVGDIAANAGVLPGDQGRATGDAVINVTGINISTTAEWLGYAESWTRKDILIGTQLNDVLIGDIDIQTRTPVVDYIGDVLQQGSNDIFYIGTGDDKVYGDAVTRNNLINGIDTVVYDFKNTLIFSGEIFQGSISGTRHKQEEVTVNVDGTPDKFYGVEQLHFVDTPSDSRNLLTGTSNSDVINGLGGDDFIYGGTDNDRLIGSSGNDRIHGGSGYDTAVFSGQYTDYSFDVVNLSLQVTNTITTEIDWLYNIEALEIGSIPTASALDVLWKGQGAFSNAGGLYNSLDAKLLSLYAPIINVHSTEGRAGVEYSYQVYGQMQSNSLLYELRFNDIDTGYADLDHGSMGSSYLRIDLLNGLPKDFISKSDIDDYFDEGGFTANGEVQVRNAFDFDLAFSGNHVITWIDENETDVDDDEWYLTNPGSLVGTKSVLVPTGTNLLNIKDGLGNPYSISDDVNSYDLQIVDNLDWGKLDLYDLDDHRGINKHYEVAGTEYKIEGLEIGDMAMGFLFDNTPLAPLGHFDLA